jgi:ubiquinone/menaquinone biosynthesis C-methylase UbiE
MRKSSAAGIASYFDGLAGRWDALMATDGNVRSAIEVGLAALNLRSGNTVLDAGCGTGVLFPFLRRLTGSAGKITGLDVSPAMIEEAGRKFPLPGLRLVCGDIEAFLKSEPEESVDAIACFQAFPHFTHQKKVLSGFDRLLAPGGRFIVFHAGSSAEINVFHATLPEPVGRHRLPPVGKLKAWAIGSGFMVLDTRDEPGLYRLVGEKRGKGTTDERR